MTVDASSTCTMYDAGARSVGGCITIREKVLYHQIHPLKLFTDWSTGLVAVWLCWRHRLAEALGVAVTLFGWFKGKLIPSAA